VFAGELNYASPDNGEIGYKVYIGPNQYFVITDIGNGRYVGTRPRVSNRHAPPCRA
jgi:hypothetical protein